MILIIFINNIAYLTVKIFNQIGARSYKRMPLSACLTPPRRVLPPDIRLAQVETPFKKHTSYLLKILGVV